MQTKYNPNDLPHYTEGTISSKNTRHVNLDKKNKKIYPENRSLLKLFALTFITLGVYQIFFYSKIGDQLNKTCLDGKNTLPYYFIAIPAVLLDIILYFYFHSNYSGTISNLIFLIPVLLWFFHLTGRVHNHLVVNEIDYNFTKKTFLMWYLLGALILIGPFVYVHKLCKAMNLISEKENNRVHPKLI